MPNSKLRIVGIDPGYDRLGIAVIDRDVDRHETVVYSDCFQTPKTDTIYDRLHSIGRELERILGIYKPDALAIESLFITKNQKTAMRVSEARGLIIYEATKNEIPVYEYGPVQIKVAITGDGTSDKQRVIKMVNMLVKVTKKKIIDDEYDAIAVALTHSACSR